MVYNGTLQNSPSFVAGKFAGALGFNGSNQYVSLPSGPGPLDFTSGQSWSIVAWAQGASVPALSGTKVVVGSLEIPGHAHGLWLGSVNGKAACTVVTSTADITAASFHLLVLTYRPGMYTLYADGVQVATFAGTYTPLSGTTLQGIGRFGDWPSPTYYWPGQIDEVGIFTRELSAADVSALWNPPTGTAIANNATGIVALYHLDETTGATAADSASAVASPSFNPANPITLSTSGGTDTITVPVGAFVAGTNPLDHVKLWYGTAIGAETDTGVSLSYNGTAQVQFTHVAGGPSTPAYYFVKGYDNAGTPNASGPSNEVFSGTPAVTVLPSSPALKYTPGNWDLSNAGVRAKTPCVGAGFGILFPGTTCQSVWDMSAISATAPALATHIDGGPTQYALFSGVVNHTPTPLASHLHSMDFIFDSALEPSGSGSEWGPGYGGVPVFLGLVLDPGVVPSAPTARTKKVLWFGDSISRGNLVNGAGQPGYLAVDVLQSAVYAALSGLDVEFGLIAFGGSGLTVTSPGGVPKLSLSYALILPGVPRSFDGIDLCCYWLGSNDSEGVGITNDLITTIQGIMVANPATQHLIFSPPNGAHEASTRNVRDTMNDPRVTWRSTAGVIASTTSLGAPTADTVDGWHPWGSANLGKLAPFLRAAITPILWPTATTTGGQLSQAQGRGR